MSLSPAIPNLVERRFDRSERHGVHASSVKYLNFPAGLYHAQLERQSCSLLKPLLRSPASYRSQFFVQRRSSAAMDFGSLLHALVLEPHRFHAGYLVLGAGEKLSPADVRDLQQRHPGKKLLSDFEFRTARLVAQKVLDRPFKGRPFGLYVEEGEVEATIFYDNPATSTPCRVRLDLWHPELVFDLKTTRHADAEGFGRSAIDLDYDMQAYMYSFADALHSGDLRRKPFVFIAAHNAEPFPVHALTASQNFIDNGQAKYERALALYEACIKLDYWPDGSVEDEIDIAPWQEFRSRSLAVSTEDAGDKPVSGGVAGEGEP